MPPQPPSNLFIPPPLYPPVPQALTLTLQHLAVLALGPSAGTTPQPPHYTPRLFLDALSVRIPVFVHEQRCSLAGEVDTDDARSWHFVAYEGVGGACCATLRIVPSSSEGEELRGGDEKKEVEEKRKATEPYHGKTGLWDGREQYIKIGRLATLAEYRGKGVAARLVENALQWAGAHRVELSACPMRERQGRDGSPAGGRKRVEGGEEGEEGWKGLVLSHAQSEVKGWWAKMGFVEDEGLGRWWEEGIEHVGTWRRVRDDEGVGYVEGGSKEFRRRMRAHDEW